MSSNGWWEEVVGAELAQGDYVKNCIVPVIPDSFTPASELETVSFTAAAFDLIIVTQSCDLAHGKVRLVAACPLYPIKRYQASIAKFKDTAYLEDIRRGKNAGYHMLAGIGNAPPNDDALVADFREIFSLPRGYLTQHAAAQGVRHRLRSPYLEHFSQSFARFFMRVGLPSDIPRFR